MRTTRTIRADIPIDVWDRLADEAAAAGIPIGRHLRNLIVKRDTKMHKTEVSGNTDPSNPGATSSTSR